ncbi:MAG TPA: MG2 domain-containing protein, partial [Bryobacteraceae bacterium]|nr:MG2 domain-containing protein [Bryobacteraceae bacterium]
MKIESRLRNLWFLLTVPLFASVLLVFSFRAIPAPNSEYPVATYNRGTLHVTVPYSGAAGSGQLTVEVLDPEDHILGRVSRSAGVDEKNGSWQVNLALAKPLPVDDLVWHRLRYRFVPSGGGAVRSSTESISRILRMPVLHIVGQQSYSSGALAAVRVVVTDSRNRPVPGRNFLRIELAPPGSKPRVLFAGLLNQRGTTEARFRLPAGLAGRAVLRYAADTPLGSAEFSQPVRLEDQASILLTTEKPIYQPGQTIHVRALALDRASHAAAAGRQLVFDIEDSRGNKVFKKTAQTSHFGIASAEFTLASEVNLGAYHLRASMDAGRSEITFQVERYVLPKFKVMLDFAAASHGYRPGDRVTGVVRANYFFGEPVNGAPVAIKASAMDVSVHEVASAEGKTGADGSWNFDFRLPDYFAGRPLSQGAARVLVEATVTDSAGHPETRGAPITVSESPLLLTAVPESGKLVPRLENQVFLLASYPDGTPAVAELRVHADGSPDQTVNTDAGGGAVIRLKPGDGAEALRIDAEDARGNRASTSVPLDTRDGLDQVLLRTGRAVYHSGDRVLLRIFTTSNT